MKIHIQGKITPNDLLSSLNSYTVDLTVDVPLMPDYVGNAFNINGWRFMPVRSFVCKYCNKRIPEGFESERCPDRAGDVHGDPATLSVVG